MPLYGRSPASWLSSNKTCLLDLHGRENALAVGARLPATAFTALSPVALGISITAWAGPWFRPLRPTPFCFGKRGKNHCSWLGPSGSLTSATLHRAAPKGLPCPIGAGSASMPRSPAPRRLRSACAQVAFGGVCASCVKDQGQELWLCFSHGGADAAERDVGAGRVEALRRGRRGRSRVSVAAGRPFATRAPGATPEGGNPAGAKPGAMALVTFPERKVTRP